MSEHLDLSRLQDNVFGRPASYVIRFSDKKKYEDAVDLYYTKLIPKLPDPPNANSPLADYYSMPLGRKQDLELLLVLKDTSHSKKDKPIIYYLLDESQGENIEAAYEKITKPGTGFRKVDAPSKEAILLDDTVRCLVEDENGNQLGLLINPPYPRFIEFHKGFFPSSKSIAPLIGLAAGLLLGPLILEIFGRSRRAY
jgi:hypothetical protein